MRYLLYLVLVAIVIFIYFFSNKALVIALSVEKLDSLRAKVFVILKERQNYILENYDSLESHEFYNQINKLLNLNERIDLEFDFKVDDISDEYLAKAKLAIEEYNLAIDKHQSLVLKYPLINKVFKYVKYNKL